MNFTLSINFLDLLKLLMCQYLILPKTIHYIAN
jgi:hypothetical protein